MENVLNRLEKNLEKRRRDDNLRQVRTPHQNLDDFFSNDYLGLSQDTELISRVTERFQKEKLGLGSTGSRLLSGESRLMQRFESFLADFFDTETALFFPSGYSANTTLLSTVSTRRDVIIYDRLIHASLREGIRLSHASAYGFAHNDTADLEKKLALHSEKAENIFVVLEAVYSMDGLCADLEEALTLCERYGAALILDEAHSTGIYGEKGAGISEAAGLSGRFFARIHTFGKASGAQGAAVLGSETLRNTLINFGAGFIYTTAPTPFTVLSVWESLLLIREDAERREKLLHLCRVFDKLSGSETGLFPSPIKLFFVKGNTECKAAEHNLRQQGFEVRAILAPTVKAGTERLRICLHTFNSEPQVRKLCGALKALSQ